MDAIFYKYNYVCISVFMAILEKAVVWRREEVRCESRSFLLEWLIVPTLFKRRFLCLNLSIYSGKSFVLMQRIRHICRIGNEGRVQFRLIWVYIYSLDWLLFKLQLIYFIYQYVIFDIPFYSYYI